MRKVMGIAFSGPLEDAAEGLASFLAGLGYAPLSIALRLRLLAHLSRWLQSGGSAPERFDAGAVERFLSDRQTDHVALSTPGAFAPLLSYLRLNAFVPQPVPAESVKAGPVESVLDAWASYLLHERMLKPGTVRYYREMARPFLATRLRENELDLSRLDARAVSDFVLMSIPSMTPPSGKLTVTALRSLLRYLFVTGRVNELLDSTIPARSTSRDSGLPRRLTPDQAQSLIAAAESQPRTRYRNRAILLLISRLGLRAAEVAALSLDDFDWRAGTVRIRGKGGRTDVMPLPADAGAAVTEHLLHGGHPAARGRALFYCSLAPYRPLSDAGVKQVVRAAGKRAGIGNVGPHLLRHTVAAATLHAGAALEEVGQLLRHRSLDSTTIYAKVDLARLTALARPWPGRQTASGGEEQ